MTKIFFQANPVNNQSDNTEVRLKSLFSSQQKSFKAKNVEVTPDFQRGANIKVIGVGGGGSNAVNRMVEAGLSGVEFIIANTDAQALSHAPSQNRINLGRGITRGLGAGSNPDVGRKAAEESHDEIKEHLEGADMIFITCGLGGGTGTGAAPIVAEIARELGILTVGIVTIPFSFEGKEQADQGYADLKDKVDTLIAIKNDKILSIIDKRTSLHDAFKCVDDILRQGIQGISSIITEHGIINVDFADVRAIMANAGTAMMGIGYGSNETRAIDAARAATTSPLLDVDIHGAKGLLFTITGGNDLSMSEVEEAGRIITEACDKDCNIIFGVITDENYVGEVKITVVATGFDDSKKAPEPVMGRMQQVGSFLPPNNTTNKIPDSFTSKDEYDIPAFMRNKINK